jgi:hypothetical protein
VKRRMLMIALLTGGLGGCFDVSSTNLRVIDNFNGDDLLPTDPDFGSWTCRAVNGPGIDFSCGRDSDTLDGSLASMRLDLAVMDPPDGLQQHGGAALETTIKTTPPTAPVDFTHYGRIAFDLKLQSAVENPLFIDAIVYVELGCTTVLPEGSERHDLYVSQGVPYSTVWHNYALTIVNFGPPAWLLEPITGGPAACLRRVDRVSFSIDAQLPDGRPGGAVLRVDNVVLE